MQEGRDRIVFAKAMLLRKGEDIDAIERVVSAQFFGDPASFFSNIDGDDEPGAAVALDLHALHSHASLTNDCDGIADLHFCGFHSGDAVAERLQAGGFAIADPVIHFDERDFRQDGVLRKAAGKLKADDWTLAAEMISAGSAELTLAAGQLGASSDAVAHSKPRYSGPDFHDPHAEFVSE